MVFSLTLSIAALVALVPAALLPFRRDPVRDGLFWALLAVGVAGPAVLVAYILASGWHTGLAPALWVTVAASLFLFAVFSAVLRESWRLAPLLFPYLFVIGAIATVWLHQPGRPMSDAAPTAWVGFHIVLSVATYALLTIGAIAGLAVTLQERALKNKHPTRLTRLLPSVSDGEFIQVRLLFAGAVILGLDLLSGMAAQYFETGVLLVLNHKVAFSLLTFAVIAILLAIHARTGTRGRRVGRYVLLAYLLITLAYPGVKFVTDVLLT